MRLIRPSKHSHPDKTLVAISLLLFKRLKSRRTESFDSLRLYLKSTKPDCDAFFIPALNFLFLIGVLSYNSKNDAFEFLRTP